MKNEVLIKVDGLTKKFSQNFKASSKSGIKKALYGLFSIRRNPSKSLNSKEFYALKDVTFEVKRGESLGLLGKNGAGKSTLLKHISGIYLPDFGEVTVSGHVEGLIELGAGFHPFLSGRDNIKQRCAMLGFDKKTQEKIIEEIISFSELDEFIDMPVQNYSSGMKARLGFASAVLVKPDVLLIDEALSVGDFEFQQKCLAKINEIKSDCAVIFVSHGIQAMKMFCDRGIVFEKGSITYEGDIDNAADFYLSNDMVNKLSNCSPLNKSPIIRNIHGDEFLNENVIKEFSFYWCDEKLKAKTCFSEGESIYIHGKVEFYESSLININKLILAIPFWQGSCYVASLSSDVINLSLDIKKNICEYLIKINSKFNDAEIIACAVLQNGPEYFIRSFLPIIKIVNSNPRVHGVFKIDYEFHRLVDDVKEIT